MAADTTAIEERIVSLYNEGKWKDIIDMSYTEDHDTQGSRLFWVLPTINELRWINDTVRSHNLRRIVGIGSGCGLLEWLLERYSGLHVLGIELDGSWWRSKYAPPIFLKNTIFVKESDTMDYQISADYALLFCYFNNGKAFRQYVANYKGNVIFVIGPEEETNRTTDPMPFDGKFEKYGWTPVDGKSIPRSRDSIVVYVRRRAP